MPWEKQFDIDTALSQAMQTFWTNGYEATSMQDLVKAMGINRGSLYDTFGNKHSLFLSALKRYDTKKRKAVLASVSLDRKPRETIQALFQGIVTEALGDKDRCGCFLVNSALELAPHNEDVAAIVTKSFSEIEMFFRTTIKKGQKLGEIPVDVNATDTARALLAAMIALRVLSRAGTEKAVLQSIAGRAIAMLG